jgi:hypothetical protein
VRPQITLGVRLTETDRFGYSVLEQIRFSGYSVPIGSIQKMEPRKFGFSNFGSVSVLIEGAEFSGRQKNTPFNSKFRQHFPSFPCSQQGQFKQLCSIKQQSEYLTHKYFGEVIPHFRSWWHLLSLLPLRSFYIDDLVLLLCTSTTIIILEIPLGITMGLYPLTDVLLLLLLLLRHLKKYSKLITYKSPPHIYWSKISHTQSQNTSHMTHL